MTVKGGSRPACAACRFQRRRCSSECSLAPFFPANQPKVFQNVHRLFGVGNVKRILDQIDDHDQKQEAMQSIKYESYIRALYPVHGCLGTVYHLQQQLVLATRELQFVQAQLAAYREVNDAVVHASDQLQLGTSPFATGDQFVGNENLLVLQPYCEEVRDNNAMGIEAQLAEFQPFGIQQDYDEMLGFNALAEDQQSFIKPKEACESSSESSLKDTPQVMEHESKDNNLTRAAACFSLTSLSID